MHTVQLVASTCRLRKAEAGERQTLGVRSGFQPQELDDCRLVPGDGFGAVQPPDGVGFGREAGEGGGASVVDQDGVTVAVQRDRQRG